MGNTKDLVPAKAARECSYFRFNGTIDKLTYKLGPEQLSAEDKEAASKILAAAKD